jgi:hypothetical protein
MAARKMQVDNILQNCSLLVIMAARKMQVDNILQNCFLLLIFLRMVAAHKVAQGFQQKECQTQNLLMVVSSTPSVC